MLRWTSSFPLDFDDDSFGAIASTQIDTQIWMMLRAYKKAKLMDFYVFDTANGKLTKVKCQNNEKQMARVQTIEYDNGFIYAWVDEGVTEWGLENKPALHKIDIKTLVWKKINVECSEGYPNFTILNNHMYVQSYVNRMIDIDLVKKTATTHKVDNIRVTTGRNLAAVNNKLYVFDHMPGKQTVSMIENNTSTRELSQNPFGSGRALRRYGSPGRFLHHSIDSTTESCQYDTYDFENGKWCRYELENFRQYSKDAEMESHCEIDGKVYAIVQPNKNSKYEIRVFELEPSLSSICLHNLVDSVVNLDPSSQSTKFQEIRASLSIPMQKEIDERFHWKTNKHRN